MREQLVDEIKRIGSADEAALWAHRRLGAKNSLLPPDATAVESAFAERLRSLDQVQPALNAAKDDRHQPVADESAAMGRSELASPLLEAERRPIVPKVIRLRDKEHRKFVASQPCLVCGRAPSDPHHLRFAQPRAFGRRVSDEFTVPLCRTHHRELHRRGDEAPWWQGIKIDPIPLALKLWQERQPDRTDTHEPLV